MLVSHIVPGITYAETNQTQMAAKVLLIKGNAMLNYQPSTIQQEEVSTQKKLLAEMGHTLTTINEPDVTLDVLNRYDLVIYTNTGWSSLGISKK